MTIVNRIRSFLGRSNDISYELYGALVTQARSREFYADAGVPDNLDGRFDMIVMHSFLVIRRLNQAGELGIGLAQELFDDMFMDMDRSLREIGVGDLSVPKKIKIMAKAFYGRCSAYESALDAGDKAAVADVIARNIYAETDAPADVVEALTDYMFEVESTLKGQDDSRLLQGDIKFPEFSLKKSDRAR
jgi:cytochrome b pre-mRNA-processing protein 3